MAKPVLLFSSAATEQYRETVFRIFSYPLNHILTDVPYRLNLVADEFGDKRQGLKNQPCLFCLVDYVPGQAGQPMPVYYPIRAGVITRVDVISQKLLLDVRLGEFAYYDDSKRSLYSSERKFSPSSDSVSWNNALRGQPHVVHATPQNTSIPMSYEPMSTWKSGGFFVIRSLAEIDIRPSGTRNEIHEIRDQQQDWQSVVDVVSEAKKLESTIFYQIRLLQAPAQSVPLRRSRSFRESIYDVDADERTDIVLHFFVRKTNSPKSTPTIVEIAISSDAVVIVGKKSIPIYHDSSSGQLERVQLIAKRQLSAQFLQVIISTLEMKSGTAEPLLVSTELYLRIKPRRLFIGLILGLFFLGTLLNAIGDHETFGENAPIWVVKLFGSALTVVAFWLAFSKFPSKAD